MSLGVFQQINVTDYWREGPIWGSPGANADCTIVSSQSGAANLRDLLWLNKLNIWQCQAGTVGGAGGNYIVRFDPFFADNSNASKFIRVLVSSSLFYELSAYDPATGDQEMYRHLQSGTIWEHVNYSDPTVVLDTDPWPLVGTTTTRSGVSSTTEGYYTSANGCTWIFFLSWDQGGTGNTTGTAFVPLANVRFGGVTLANVAIFIDLETGLAVPVGTGFPNRYNTTPQNIYQSGQLFGANVLFDTPQFLPDDDSKAASPVGQIFMSATTDDGADNGTHYFKYVDWNPSNVTSIPIRVHLRERLVTRSVTIGTQDHATFPGVSSNTVITPALEGRTGHQVNLLTNRPTAMWALATSNFTDFNNFLYINAMLETTEFPVVDVVTPPSPRTAVQTNRTVICNSDVVGDLGEPIGGTTLNWTLQNVTSRDEIVDTSLLTPGAGGAAEPLDQFPVDRSLSLPFEVRETTSGDVESVLVETVDYTIVEATGVITVIAPHPVSGSVYNADYAHLTDPGGNPFGTLLAASSVSDTDGQGATRVRFADVDANAGFIDKLSVTDV